MSDDYYESLLRPGESRVTVKCCKICERILDPTTGEWRPTESEDALKVLMEDDVCPEHSEDCIDSSHEDLDQVLCCAICDRILDTETGEWRARTFDDPEYSGAEPGRCPDHA